MQVLVNGKELRGSIVPSLTAMTGTRSHLPSGIWSLNGMVQAFDDKRYHWNGAVGIYWHRFVMILQSDMHCI